MFTRHGGVQICLFALSCGSAHMSIAVGWLNNRMCVTSLRCAVGLYRFDVVISYVW